MGEVQQHFRGDILDVRWKRIAAGTCEHSWRYCCRSVKGGAGLFIGGKDHRGL